MNNPRALRVADRIQVELSEIVARRLKDPRRGFVTFTGERSSQLPEDMGAGLAWGDFDNDGDDDLFLVGAGGGLALPAAERAPSALYENLGDGTFRQVGDLPEIRILGMGAAWGDVDGDGWLDLALSGYGSLLLQQLCEIARGRGAKLFFLEVRPSNAAALALYERHGFQCIGLRRDYYPAPAGREDALILGLSL